MTAQELILELQKLPADQRITLAVRTFTKANDVAYVDPRIQGNVIFACLPEGYVVSKRNVDPVVDAYHSAKPEVRTVKVIEDKQIWNREFDAKFQPPQQLVDIIQLNPHVRDDSWHHDTMPHLSYYHSPKERYNGEPQIELWWDAIMKADREVADTMRFHVVRHDIDEQFDTDFVDEAVTKFHQYVSKVGAQQ